MGTSDAPQETATREKCAFSSCLVVVEMQLLKSSSMPQAIRQSDDALVSHGVVAEVQGHDDAAFQGGGLRLVG